jgi:hypothetical protein
MAFRRRDELDSDESDDNDNVNKEQHPPGFYHAEAEYPNVP